MVSGSVVADLETERLEERPNILVGSIKQIDIEERKYVEQVLVLTWFYLCLQRCHFAEPFASQSFEFA